MTRTLIRREHSTCNATTCGTCAQKVRGTTKAWCLLFNDELRPRKGKRLTYDRLDDCLAGEQSRAAR